MEHSEPKTPSIDWGKVGWKTLDGVRRYWAIIVTIVGVTVGWYVAFGGAMDEMRTKHSQGMQEIKSQSDEQKKMLERMRTNEEQIRNNREALIRIVAIMERIEKNIERKLQ